MEYKVEKAEKSTVKISITLNHEEWEAAQEAAYNKTKGKYSLPGFRKGKVPMKMLENAYGKGIFYEDAINESFPKYYYEILEKEPSVEAVSAPDLDIGDFSDDGITYVATVAVKPEVKIGAYTGISFAKTEYNVKDEAVEAEIERLRERNSRTVDVTDRPAADGDEVVIDYSGSVDGEKFEGGTAEKQPLTLGSHSFIPGFEEQVVGMSIGEEKDIAVRFPEDYHAENLKGKDAVFAIKLHEIRKKELPEVNDEFVKDAVGAESVEAYRKEVKERLEKQNADRAERELEDEMVKKIAETAEIEIPDALIENQADNMVRDMEYRLMYQGLRMEDYLKYVGKTKEEYRKEFFPQAAEIVKQQLVLDKIITDQKIEATEEDIEKRIEEMAKDTNMAVPDYKKHMQAKQMDYVKNDVIVKKLFAFLKENNEISVKKEGAKKPAAKKSAKAKAAGEAEQK
ncbi:MAG: trigger factor [Firmicutes bacterium]|nr:trigger factor [Bacillota bacterium]